MVFKPHAYQEYAIQRIIADTVIGLFLEMGLGKTAVTLTAINDLRYNRFSVGKVLVIAPKKVAEVTWSMEAAKWDHLRHLRIMPVLGSASRRVRALNTPADVYVINRENVVWLVQQYRNAWPFDMVVVDELSSFKNHQAKRFKALTWVRGHIRRFVGLTGTPAPNGILDLWAQVYLLDEGRRLGKYITHFRERYFEPDQRGRDRIYSYAPKPGAEEIIRALIGDICVSMKAEDYLKLPECVSITVPVLLEDKAAAAYKRLERDMLLEVDEGVVDAGTAAVLTNKLLQLCNGAVYGDGGVAEIHRCKLEAFLELVEGLNGQAALVFYNFRHDLDRLTRALAKTGLRVRRMEGAEDAQEWNAGKVDVLLAHPASCAYGLNLQEGGHHIVWFGLNWSLELYQQANARLFRQGQKLPVFIHHLAVRGGTDEDVLAALESKGDTQEALMQALKARIERVKR